MKFDLHIHTRFSFDSLASPLRIIEAARRQGLDGIAITDHDTIAGALEAQRVNTFSDFEVIIGAEIATNAGDIIGLFIEEDITSRDALTVAEEIRGQGGVVVLPHPFRGHRLSDELINAVDVIEIFNARTDDESNKKAKEMAKRRDKLVCAGSDAHFLSEIGNGVVITQSKDLREAMMSGEVTFTCRSSPSYVRSASQLIKSVKLKQYSQIPRRVASLAARIVGFTR